MKITNGHICRDCIYFDPEQEVCMIDSEYKPTSEYHQACFSFASDDDEINTHPRDYSISDLYDEEDDNDFYDEY